MPKYVIEQRAPGGGKAERGRAARHQREVEQGDQRPGPRDPLAAELRDRRQDLLRLRGAGRGHPLRAPPRCGGFPADKVTLVSTVIDPSTGD